MITTTLNRIRAYHPCAEGWATLLRGLGKTQADDEPLLFARIVEINGLDDALWCCRAEPQLGPQLGPQPGAQHGAQPGTHSASSSCAL